jgi:hypothetical protein
MDWEVSKRTAFARKRRSVYSDFERIESMALTEVASFSLFKELGVGQKGIRLCFSSVSLKAEIKVWS